MPADNRKAAAGAAILILLGISGVLVGIFSVPSVHSAAQTASTPGANWDAVFANPQATDYSAQTQLTPSNVNSLQVAWMFPFPAVFGSLYPVVNGFGAYPLNPTQGPGSPPLVHGGIVYEMTNNFQV